MVSVSFFIVRNYLSAMNKVKTAIFCNFVRN
jgi:hypothetical protein